MESNDTNTNPKSATSENYDPNNPQDLTKPAFNSATDHRSTDDLPGIENLDNQELGEDEVPQDPERLWGTSSQTDLGNGDRTQQDKDDEKIIDPK
jgi:hypothetical protein